MPLDAEHIVVTPHVYAILESRDTVNESNSEEECWEEMWRLFFFSPAKRHVQLFHISLHECLIHIRSSLNYSSVCEFSLKSEAKRMLYMHDTGQEYVTTPLNSFH